MKVTPLSGYADRDAFQAPFTFDESSGLIRVSLPAFDSQVRSTIIKVKSTLLMKRVGIELITDTHAYLHDPDHIITEDYVGGIISIARFSTKNPYWDDWRECLIDLKYQKESGNIYPMAAIYYEGKPLKLEPGFLHSMRIIADWDWQKIEVPTAWVDPGFDGILYVPFMDDCRARLIVSSYFYPGSNRYQGYTGDDRLYRSNGQ